MEAYNISYKTRYKFQAVIYNKNRAKHESFIFYFYFIKSK